MRLILVLEDASRTIFEVLVLESLVLVLILVNITVNVLNRSSLVSTVHVASREQLSFQARLKNGQVKLGDDVTLGGRLFQTCAAAIEDIADGGHRPMIYIYIYIYTPVTC